MRTTCMFHNVAFVSGEMRVLYGTRVLTEMRCLTQILYSKGMETLRDQSLFRTWINDMFSALLLSVLLPYK